MEGIPCDQILISVVNQNMTGNGGIDKGSRGDRDLKAAESAGKEGRVNDAIGGIGFKKRFHFPLNIRKQKNRLQGIFQGMNPVGADQIAGLEAVIELPPVKMRDRLKDGGCFLKVNGKLIVNGLIRIAGISDVLFGPFIDRTDNFTD